MKITWRLLGYSALYVIGGLVMGCIVVSLLIGLWMSFASGPSFANVVSGGAIGLVIATFAAVFGILPALVFGATSYAFLLSRGLANYGTTALAGAVPGLALLVFGSDRGPYFLGYGTAVAGCTHFIAKWHLKRRGMSVDSAFRPAPLRDGT